MAYADRNVAGSRVVATVFVAVMVALLGYAFVTGLATSFIKKTAEKLDTFDVNEPPPPPEEVPPPPPPPDSPVPPPPTTIVTPPVQTVQTQNTVATTPVPQPPPPITPPAPPAPPAPPPPPPPPPPKQAAKKAVPRGAPGSWVTDADYPASAARAEQAGTVGFRLDVDAAGRVSNCTVTSSSGSAVLDSTACNLMKRRGKFTPAEDESGNKIPGSYANRFTWKLPQD